MADIELNTKIFRKDNLDIVYSVTGKKQLNGMPLDVAPAPLNPPNYESTAVGDGEMES